MKALISPNESFSISWASAWNHDGPKWVSTVSTIEGCYRVVQTEQDGSVFEVAQPLFWADCPDDCQMDKWYYKDGQCHKKPENLEVPTTPVEEMP